MLLYVIHVSMRGARLLVPGSLALVGSLVYLSPVLMQPNRHTKPVSMTAVIGNLSFQSSGACISIDICNYLLSSLQANLYNPTCEPSNYFSSKLPINIENKESLLMKIRMCLGFVINVSMSGLLDVASYG